MTSGLMLFLEEIIKLEANERHTEYTINLPEISSKTQI